MPNIDAAWVPMEWLTPFCGWVPTVRKPEKVIGTNEKIYWTLFALLVYLICGQIPLYGTRIVEAGYDPLEYMRKMLASQKGTLMEFGVGPLFTTSMFLQMLRIADIFAMDTTNKEHWEIWESFEKFCVMILCGFQASVAVWSGMYGDCGVANSILIVVQLSFAGFLVILFDDLLSLGYGFGSATSMYIACSHAERIVWDAFSPTTINLGSGPQFEGAVINLFHQVVTRGNTLEALRNAFYRDHLTNLTQLMATFLMIAITTYLSGIKLKLPLARAGSRGHNLDPYTIKFIYAGNYPVILYYSILTNFYFLSRTMDSRGHQGFIHNFIGKFGPADDGRGLVPKTGLIYWLTSPRSFQQILKHPMEGVFQIVFIIFVISGLSSLWVEVNGSSARDVAKNLARNELTIRGYRAASLYKVLQRYIPVCAILGGGALGMVTIFAELMGSVSSGSGTLMAVGIVINMYEKLTSSVKSGSTDLISHRRSRWD